MAIDWAGLSPKLLLPLDRAGSQPLRAQLEGGLRDAIRDGRLRPGERLPSSREMARELGVSRGLVQECYTQLYAEGYLTAQVGSATRVADTAAVPRAPATEVPAAEVPANEAPPAIDFATGVPDLGSFPRGDWTWATREAMTRLPTATLDYPDPRGDQALREILAGYLRRVRASDADPEHIVCCTGFAQGLGLVLRTLAAAGVRRVAFEDPGYGDGTTMATAAWAGVEAVPVPVDADGLDVAALAASGVRAVQLTPAHQWPTGVVLAPERRRELISWAESCDGLIIEDDYDAEFRYDREPVGTLQGLAPARVFSLGTVSKSLAPALRAGWVVCPPAYGAELLREKRLADRGSPLMEQLALARLIESGRYDRHLRRMRGVYAARRGALVEALAAYAPHVSLSGLAAGFHAVAHLPAGADEDAVVRAARERSVGVSGMGTYRSLETPAPPRLVLGFGNLPERAIHEGIATIADLL